MGVAHADARHGVKELLEPVGVLVERGEEVLADLRFVLRMAGAQGFGERSPEGVQAGVGHLQQPTDVGRFVAVEEEIGGGRVAIVAIDMLEHVERDERVEEVVNAAGVELEVSCDGLGAARSRSEVGEEPQLDRAQERL